MVQIGLFSVLVKLNAKYCTSGIFDKVGELHGLLTIIKRVRKPRDLADSEKGC